MNEVEMKGEQEMIQILKEVHIKLKETVEEVMQAERTEEQVDVVHHDACLLATQTSLLCGLVILYPMLYHLVQSLCIDYSRFKQEDKLEEMVLCQHVEEVLDVVQRLYQEVVKEDLEVDNHLKLEAKEIAAVICWQVLVHLLNAVHPQWQTSLEITQCQHLPQSNHNKIQKKPCYSVTYTEEV